MLRLRLPRAVHLGMCEPRVRSGHAVSSLPDLRDLDPQPLAVGTMSSRPSRTRRRRVRPLIEVTDGDLRLLTLIGLTGWITGQQLARGTRRSENYLSKRLRRLYDARLIDRSLVGTRQPTMHRLTRAGLRLLARHSPDLAGQLHLPRALELGRVLHHQLLVDARLYIADLSEQRGARLLAWASGSSRSAEHLGFAKLRLIPDAVAIIQPTSTANKTVAICIEADTGSERLTALTSKFGKYRQLAADGQVDAMWFVADGGAARLESVTRLLADAGLEGWSRVLSREHVVTRPVRELPRRQPKGPDAGGRAGGPAKDVRPSVTTGNSEDSSDVTRTQFTALPSGTMREPVRAVGRGREGDLQVGCQNDPVDQHQGRKNG